MNAYAIFAVNEHLEYLIDEAARNRAHKAAMPAPSRASASGPPPPPANVRLHVATATYETSSIFPKLEDYPYRG